MVEKKINYNDGYLYVIGNELYRDNCRYFEPNMSENNFSILSCIGDRSKIIITKEEYANFLIFEEERIRRAVENYNLDLEKDKDKIQEYKYDVELVDNCSFEKCDIVYVGQTLSDKKYDSNQYEFLKKYNVKNLKFLDAQLFNIFLGIEKLSDDGTMIINIPSTYLYRNDTSSMCLRKYLIDNKLIKGIALIKGTCDISDYEIVIEVSKKENTDVVFVDAKNNDYLEFYEPIESYGDKESNNFNQSIKSIAVNIFSLIELRKKHDGVVEVININRIIENDYCLVVGDYVKTSQKRTHRNLYEIARDIDFAFEELEENCRNWAKL